MTVKKHNLCHLLARTLDFLERDDGCSVTDFADMFFMVASERSDVEMVKWFCCIRCRVTSVLVEYNLTFTDVLLQILAKRSVLFQYK